MKNRLKTPGDLIEGLELLGTAYRIREAITIVVLDGSSETFQDLEKGSILIPVSPRNSAGMIEARLEDTLVRVFQRDLDDASERVRIDTAIGFIGQRPEAA